MAKDDDKKAEQAGGDEGDAPKKSRKKLFILIGAGVAIAAIGGGAAFFFLSKSDSNMAAKPAEPVADAPQSEEGEAPAEATPSENKAAAAPEAATGKEQASGDQAAPSGAAALLGGAPKVDIDFGCTLPLKPFHLNLGNPLENRFMRLEVAVEYPCNNATEQEINRRMPQLRDAVVSVASRKTREFLLSPDGKDQLRLELLNRVNHYMSRNVDNVFITDILIE